MQNISFKVIAVIIFQIFSLSTALPQLDTPLRKHILGLENDYGFFDDLGNNLYRDVFQVVCDRSVDKLLDAICEYNFAQIDKALEYDMDAFLFDEEWGQQTGLIMGYERWTDFIFPRLKHLSGRVREAGKFLMIHSCGDVDELFNELVTIGVNCFNPFQVIAETKKLLELGKEGGLILSPSHAMEGDTSMENILAFIKMAKNQ